MGKMSFADFAALLPGKLILLAVACFAVCWAGSASGILWLEVVFGVVGILLYLGAIVTVALMATGVIDG